MFGMLPDMGEMLQQVNDFKNKFERFVAATEKNTQMLADIQKHLDIQSRDDDAPVIDAEFTEDK